MQVVLGLIPGGNQIFLILYCFLKKACERERTHLMAKKIPNFLLVKVEALKVKGAYWKEREFWKLAFWRYSILESLIYFIFKACGIQD